MQPGLAAEREQLQVRTPFCVAFTFERENPDIFFLQQANAQEAEEPGKERQERLGRGIIHHVGMLDMPHVYRGECAAGVSFVGSN